MLIKQGAREREKEMFDLKTRQTVGSACIRFWCASTTHVRRVVLACCGTTTRCVFLSKIRNLIHDESLLYNPSIVPIAQLVSKVVIYSVCQRIEIPRDIDAELSKPGFRALMIILAEVKYRYTYR